MVDDIKKKRQTLTDEAITTKRGLGRRALLLGVFGGATALATGTAQAVTDQDGGARADPAGQGRGNSGISNSDSGNNADPAGRGRGITNSNSGSDEDPVGRGRGRSGISNSNSGANADPAGRGRGSSGIGKFRTQGRTLTRRAVGAAAAVAA